MKSHIINSLKKTTVVFCCICSFFSCFSSNLFSQELPKTPIYENLVFYQNPIVFVGSSSIKLWKNLQKDFKNYNVLNKGIGGAQINDILHHSDELIFNYNPKQVVLYIGENDLKYNSITADTIFERTKKLFDLIIRKSPLTSIVYISIKPSPARDSFKEKLLLSNKLIKEYVEKNGNVVYVDIYDSMLNKSGDYRYELFKKDKIHLKPAGYKIWREALKPYLMGK